MTNRFVRRSAGAQFRIKTRKIPDLLMDSHAINRWHQRRGGSLFSSAHQELSMNSLADRGIGFGELARKKIVVLIGALARGGCEPQEFLLATAFSRGAYDVRTPANETR